MKYFLFDKVQKYVTRINTEYLIESHYTEEINTAGQLEFTLPATMRLPDNVFYVCVTDPNDETSYLMFKIVTEKVTDEKVTYTCIESAYDELASYTYIKDKRPTAIASAMLQMVLDGTRWSVGACPEVSPKFCSFYYISALEAIQKIVNLWGFEVQFQVKIDGITNEIKQRNINLYTKLGKRTNKRFEYGSNLLSVTQANDSTGLYTALVGRGKGVQVSDGDTDTDPDGYGRRITFADVVWSTQSGNPLNKPAGQEYLEDPNATAAYGFPDGHPRIGFVTFQDCEDPNELIQLTYDKLQEVNHPQVQFSASIADVGSLDLGDTIAIVRHDIGIEYYTRVFKVVHDLLDSSNNTVELGDNIAGSNSITQQISNIQNNQSNVQNAIDTIVMNGSDGNKLFFGTDFPANGTDGDIFYKTLENGGTEMYIYKDGGWQLVVSTEELDAVQKQVDEQTSQIQQAVDDANSAVSKADEAVAKVGDAETTAKNAQATANQNKQDIATVQVNIENTKNDLQSTAQELQGVSNDLNSVKQQAISQGRTIIDIQKSTVDLGTKMADVQGNVSSLHQTTRSLQSSVQDNTNNISNVKQTATQLSSTISNLQNAGENLVINSTFSQGSYHWNMEGYQISQDVLFMNSKGVSITQTGLTAPNWKDISATDKIPVSQGQTISFGCWVKTSGIDTSGDGNNGAQIGINWYADKNSRRIQWNDTYDPKTFGNHDWVYIKMENVKVPEDSNFVNFHMFLTQNGTAQFVLPLMVFGSTLPSWSPSPLDSATATDMSSVKQTVSSLQSTVQSNTGDISSLKQTATQLQSSIRDNANNISSIKQTANSIQSTVSNMKIGGTNLLPQTENYTGYIKWGFVEYIPTYSYDDYSFTPQTKIIHLWTDGNNPVDNASPTPDNRPVNLIQGNVYTFSAYVWHYGENTKNNELVTLWADKGNKPLELGTVTTTLTGTATKYKVTFTAPQTGNYTRFRVVHKNGSEMTNGSMFIAEMKLEDGNIATDWSPSPYDLASQTDMSSVQQKVDSITSTVQSQSGDISQLKQTANSLQSNIQSKADISQITQLSNAIQSVVQNVGTIFPNGDFADSNIQAYWSPWDTTKDYTNITFDSATYNGSFGNLLLHASGGGWTKAISTEYIPVQPNKSVTVSLASRGDWYGSNGKPQTLQCYVHFYDSKKNETETGNFDLNCSNNQQWYDNSVTYGCNSNECYIRVEICLQGNQENWAHITNVKVSSDGGESISSKISQMSDDINLRVQKGDLLSQINIQAGKTLIQSNKLYLDASSVVFSGSAFIPSAAITDLSADKITTGTLNAANVHVINMDVANLVGDKTSFVRSQWQNAYGAYVNIESGGMSIGYGNWFTKFDSIGMTFTDGGDDLGGFTRIGMHGAPSWYGGLAFNAGGDAEFLSIGAKDYHNDNQNPIPSKLLWARREIDTYGYNPGWNFGDDVWTDKIGINSIQYGSWNIHFGIVVGSNGFSALTLTSGIGNGFYWGSDGSFGYVTGGNALHNVKGSQIVYSIGSDGVCHSWGGV